MNDDYEADLKRLYRLVKRMRESQRRNFSRRDRDALEEAMRNEIEVDREIQRLEGVVGEQRTMF